MALSSNGLSEGEGCSWGLLGVDWFLVLFLKMASPIWIQEENIIFCKKTPPSHHIPDPRSVVR